MVEEGQEKPEIEEPRDVNLQHRHNYIGGPYAYKNSSKQGKRLDPENLTELVLMTKPGQAAKVNIAFEEEEVKAGTYPQHNTKFSDQEQEDFTSGLELIPSRTMKAYEHLIDVDAYKNANFEERICTMTKQRLNKIKAQFSHLSQFAFNQMLNIPRPDKRDFPVWHRVIEKNDQVIIAFPEKKSKKTLFVQVIQYDGESRISGIKHCSFADGEPLVINESIIDKHGNYRQIAHLGTKGDSDFYNSVERFDDGTVSWIITHNKETGAAVLRPNGEILFLEGLINDSAKVAARNLGAEKVKDGKWLGEFDIDACQLNSNPVQESFKQKVRQQIGQIVDGAAIPGLDPIFWVRI